MWPRCSSKSIEKPRGCRVRILVVVIDRGRVVEAQRKPSKGDGTSMDRLAGVVRGSYRSARG